MITCFVSAATFGPVDCLSTRLFLDGPKIAEEFEVNGRLARNSCAVGAKPGEKAELDQRTALMLQQCIQR